MSSALIEDLRWRGLLYQSTDIATLEKRLNEGPITAYCGIDPTADSMHVGHLVPMLMLRRLKQAGHNPIALVGGVTGMIGDPKPDSERQLLDLGTIERNVAGLRAQLQRLIGDDNIPVVNNAEWLRGISLVDFLRDTGKYFNISQMLAKDSVQSRLEREQGISFTEFTYQTLQAYDFYYLYKEKNCQLQICGSDQWGNVVAGLDLIRKKLGKEAYGLTAPLITKADGKKFGKSETGTVWLDANKTSPYAFYQFWLNVEDAKAVDYLKVYSFKSHAEIEAIAAEMTANPASRAAQRALAEELTTLVHSPQALQQAVAASQALFGHAELSGLDAATLRAVCDTIPHMRLETGAALPELATALVETGLIDSKNKARQEIAAGGIYVNNVRAKDTTVLAPADLIHGAAIVIRKGKRNCGAVVVG